MSRSFKWTEDMHTLFFELCSSEVVKDNRFINFISFRLRYVLLFFFVEIHVDVLEQF